MAALEEVDHGLIFAWDSGGVPDPAVLGGKGASLVEMTRLGMPVPPGFTITTRACAQYFADGHLSGPLRRLILEHVGEIERAVGRRLGDATNPLLLSIRSGAPVSMPGMMDTVLDLGVNDQTVDGLARQSGDEAFAWDSYGRFVQMYAAIALGVDPGTPSERAAGSEGVAGNGRLARDGRARVRRMLESLSQAGTPVPQDPLGQLEQAIVSIFESWNGARARRYRSHHGIPDSMGTAATVQAMVFGNLGQDSGTGVAFTRDPVTGAATPYGEFLANAQGEDVVAGKRQGVPLAELGDLLPQCYAELRHIMDRLEAHYRDMCDIEFTVERGTLWVLQTRVGKRSPIAAIRMAVAMVDEGLIDRDEAVRRVPPRTIDRALHTHFAPGATYDVLTVGLPASPGAAVGRAVFDPDEAEEFADGGIPVILVRCETSPHDLHGMLAAEGILTSHGGLASHAAVVARDLGKPAVVGAAAIEVDLGRGRLVVGDTVVERGQTLSIDGASGEVVLGRVDIDEPVDADDALRLRAWARCSRAADRE